MADAEGGALDLMALALRIQEDGFEQAKEHLFDLEKIGAALVEKFSALATPLNAAKAGFAAIALVGADLFKDTLKDSADMHDALERFIRDTGADADAQHDFAANLRALYGEVTVSIDEIASALTIVQQKFGVTGELARESAGQLIEYAEATGREVGDTTKGVIGIIQAYGLSLADITSVEDALVVTHQKTGVATEELEMLVTRNAAAFRAAGLSVYDAMAIVDEFAQSGLRSRQAMNLLTQALSSKEFAASHLSLQQALRDVAAITDPTERAQKAMELFGASTGVKLAQALALGTEGLRKAGEEIAKSEGATERAADAATNTFEHQATLIERQVKVQFLGLADAIVAAVVPTQRLAREFAPLAGSLLVAITTAATLVLGITALAAAFTVLRTAATAAGLALGPVGIALGLVTALVALFAYQSARTRAEVDEFRQGLQKLSDEDLAHLGTTLDQRIAQLEKLESGLRGMAFRATLMIGNPEPLIADQELEKLKGERQAIEEQKKARQQLLDTDFAAPYREEISTLEKLHAIGPLTGKDKEEAIKLEQQLKAAIDAGNLSQKQRADLTAALANVEGVLDKTNPLKVPGSKDGVAKARLEAAKQAAQSELQEDKLRLEGLQSTEDAAYAQGKESLAQYYASREAMTRQATANELHALEAERAAIEAVKSTKPEEEVQKQARLREVDSQITQARIAGETAVGALVERRRQEELQLAEQVRQAEGQALTARGQAHAVALAQIDEETRRYALALAQRGGLDAAAQAKRVQEFRDTLAARADYDEQEQAAQRELQAIETERAEIEQRIAAGQISQKDGEQALAASAAQHRTQLVGIVAEMERLAAFLKDPALQNAVLKLKIEIGDKTQGTQQGLVANLLGDLNKQFQSAAQNIAQTFTGALAQAFTGHWKNAGKTILSGLGQILMQMGEKMLITGAALIGLLPALSNPFTSGAAMVAAGAIILAAGAALSAMATGGGGGGGGSGGGSYSIGDVSHAPQVTNITLTQSAAAMGGSITPLTPVQVNHPVFLSPRDPSWQRQLAESITAAQRRGLVGATG